MSRSRWETAKKVLMISWRAISVFLEQATAQGSKSTILRPFQWLALVFALALIGALRYSAPTWLLVALFTALLVPVVALLVAFFYCLFSRREGLVDALRTERYSIQKLAIEKGYVGDSITGTLRRETPDAVAGSTKLISPSEDQK